MGKGVILRKPDFHTQSSEVRLPTSLYVKKLTQNELMLKI
jgi:hypothetical protein